jgi:hypothetical protein
VGRRRTTQLTFGVAIGTSGVIDESGGVPSVQGIDADAVVEGICVLSSCIIPKEPSRGHQETGSIVEAKFRYSSLPVEVYRCWENQFSCVFWGEICKVGVAFKNTSG